MNFYRQMTRLEQRTLWGCAAGWSLDGLDFMVYPLVIGTIISLWHVNTALAGAAITVTLIFSAIGGWLGGIASDHIGRVRTLRLTIIWFSAFSLACAFTQDFNQLMIARALLGLGFGGEWTAGAVLMAEVVRPQYRGRAVGTVQSAYAVGWGIAVIAQATIYSCAPEEWAWRFMFALGCLPAIGVFFLLQKVEEPSLAVKARERARQAGEKGRSWRIFGRAYLFRTVMAALMLTGAQGGFYALSSWLPRFLTTERGMSTVGSTGYLATLIIGSLAGFLACAWLVDRLGRRRIFWISAGSSIIVVIAYLQMSFPSSAMWLLGFPLGFFEAAPFSAFGPFLSEIFPTALRGSGQGFCYSFGRGLGAIFPTLVGYLAETKGLGNAITVFALTAYGIFFLTSCLFPETAGKELES